MKNIYEVLRQKEAELQQLQKEVEALRVAAELLADDYDSHKDATPRASTGSAPVPVSAARPSTGNVASPARQFP